MRKLGADMRIEVVWTLHILKKTVAKFFKKYPKLAKMYQQILEVSPFLQIQDPPLKHELLPVSLTLAEMNRTVEIWTKVFAHWWAMEKSPVH